MPERIKKIDIARYLILLKHGGVVVDVDFEAFKTIDSLIQGHAAVLIEESEDQSINCAWIASVRCIYKNIYFQKNTHDYISIPFFFLLLSIFDFALIYFFITYLLLF